MAAERFLITGASGFIGVLLATALLAENPSATLTIADVVEPAIAPASEPYKDRITALKADLTDPSAVANLLKDKFDACYFLHGIMSGGSEANLDLGLKVNIDSHRACLDFLRTNHPGSKVIFTSSLAVYGPSEPDRVVSESTMPLPQSSYGMEKYLIELLVNDYSRRGLIDGRIVRLPTVVVRPGAPSAATSSFASGIVREPLNGQPSTLPVSEDLKMWLGSPKTAVGNLAYVKDIPAEKFGLTRLVCLPGKAVAVSEILTALEKVGGKKARDLVKYEKDEVNQKIVESWPSYLDTSRAISLGMKADNDVLNWVQDYADSIKK